MSEPSSFDLAALQTVIKWIGTDGQENHLYRQDDDPSLQVTVDMKYDRDQEQSVHTGLFRICVPVDLKASPHEKTPLLLYIRPERIASLLLQHSDDPELPAAQDHDSDELICAKLGPRPVCFKFVLSSPADMVVPSGVPLVPTKQRPHGEQMDLVKDLAQTVSFSIFLRAHDFESLSLLGGLADAIADPSIVVRSHAEADKMAPLYSGRGGILLNVAEFLSSGPRGVPSLPPAYDNVGVAPPMAPLDQDQVAGPSTSTTSRKRQRDSEVDGEASRGASVEDMLDMLRRAREEDRAFMKEFVVANIQTLRSDIMAEIQNQKTDLMQHIDKCTDELDYRVNDVEKGIEDIDYGIVVQVDDAVISYKIEVEEEKETFKTEMREFVTEKLEEVQEIAADEIEERVMERLNGAKVSIEQARLSLE